MAYTEMVKVPGDAATVKFAGRPAPM